MAINPQTSALIMIDMQQGFIDERSSLWIAGAQASVPSCAQALEAARNVGMPIWHVRRSYSFDGSDVEPVRYQQWLQGDKPLCAEGPWPQSLEAPSELVALDSERLLVKPRFSAFFETDLHEQLQQEGITHVILIGTTTPNCIRSTGYDAISYNYDVTVLSDATSSRSEAVQAANIEDMATIGMTIMTAEEFAQALQG